MKATPIPCWSGCCRRVIDLALVRTPFPSHGFLTQMLPSQPMLAIWDSARWDLCVENHGLALDQLAACPLVLYRRWEPIIQAAFDRHGLQPRIVAHDDSARTCLAMARADWAWLWRRTPCASLL